jgi:HSP20 family molecular chaperone IbpA
MVAGEISARYHEGVLEILVPKKPEFQEMKKARQIAVE